METFKKCLYVLSGSDESLEVFAGDVTSYQLHNLKPGTTYDLKVLAQYNTGFSAPLIGQGTTCKLITLLFITGLCAQFKCMIAVLTGSYNPLSCKCTNNDTSL